MVDADKAAKQGQINRRTTTNTAQHFRYRDPQESLLANFQTAIKNLGSTTTPQFLGYTATTSDPKVLTSTASNYGGHRHLCHQGQQPCDLVQGGDCCVSPVALPVPFRLVRSKSLKMALPDPVDIQAGATLQSVRDAINTQQGANGFSANIVTDSFGSRLVLGSTVTGLGSDITLSGIAGLEITAGQKMGATPDATSAGAIGELAADASFTVDGLAITSKYQHRG